MMKRWRRAVPFADELFDRWERAEFLGFGPDTSIYDSSLVLGDVQVGEGVWIGPFTVLDGSGGLRIGDRACISAGVQIYSHDTVARTLTGGTAKNHIAPVSIGARAYLAPNVVVAAGVSIGVQCVVGAQSFVSSDVPDRCIAVGAPARVVGRVEIDGDEISLVYDRQTSS
ncbi:MAG: acyltransferase [Deltaproteobacteria bacterium]|nr:acyltransferase [Deltaproteobacteria bacterium]